MLESNVNTNSQSFCPLFLTNYATCQFATYLFGHLIIAFLLTNDSIKSIKISIYFLRTYICKERIRHGI